MTATTAEVAIIELVAAEIMNVLGTRITSDEARVLAAQTFKIIDDYNRTIAIAAMDKAKDSMIAAAVAAANNKQSTEGK